VIIENPIFTHLRVYAYLDRSGVSAMVNAAARSSFIRRAQAKWRSFCLAEEKMGLSSDNNLIGSNSLG